MLYIYSLYETRKYKKLVRLRKNKREDKQYVANRKCTKLQYRF